MALRGRRAAKRCVVCLLCLFSTLIPSWELTTSRTHRSCLWIPFGTCSF